MADRTIPAFKILRGNIGVGTTLPGSLFNAYVASQRQLDFYGGTSPSGNNYVAALKLGRGKASNSALEIKYDSENAEHAYITRLYTNATLHFDKQGTDHMTITSVGKVGIGTASPGAVLLDVRSTTTSGGSFDVQDSYTDITSGASSLWLSNSNTTAGNYIRINFADAVGGSSTALIAAKCTDHTNNYGDLQFWTRGATGYGTRLHIDQEGNVGIDQTDPKAKLHIGGSFGDAANDLGTAALAIKQTSTSAENGIYIERSAEDKGYYIGISGVDGLTFRRNFGGTKSDIMSLTRDGNVGIGTATPTSSYGRVLHLHANASGHANVHITNTTTGSGSGDGTDIIAYESDTYIRNREAGKMYIGTNNTNHITILSGGDVGIGTTAPSQQLMVWEGSSSVSLGEYSNGAVIWLDGVNGDLSGGDYFNIWADGNAALRFGYGTAQKVSMLSNGNVGIGTNDPAILFDVKSSKTHNFIGRFVNTSTVGWGAYIEGGGDSADYSLLIRNQASSDLFAIMGDGEIRVANQTLVDSANTNYKMTFPDLSGIAMGSAYTYANIYGSGGNLYLKANAYAANLGNNPSKIYLVTAGNSGSTAPDVVVKGGIVGIGTDAPDSLGLNIASASTDPTASYTGNSQLVIGLVGSTTHKLAISRDTDGNNAYIHSYQDGVGAKNLILQPGGGSVGIGTDAPTGNLHIKPASGNAYLKLESDNTSADVQLMLDSANSTRNAHVTFYNAGVQKGGVGYASSDAIMKMWGGNNPADDHLCITSTGVVGIGTTAALASSSERLAVYSSSTGHSCFKNSSDSTGTVYIRNASTTADTWQPYLICADTGGNRAGLAVKYSTAGLKVHGQGGIEFWTGSSFGGGTVKMTILSGGNVGIGTNNPGTLLHLRQYDTTGPTITMSNNPKTGYINWWGAAGGGTDRTDQFEINAVVDGYGATIGAKTYIRFKTDGLGATDERMRIASDGNVGIGTNNPLAHLMVGAGTRNAGAAVQNQAGYFSGTKTAFAGSGNKGLWQGQLHVADDSALAAGIGGAITFGATQDNTNGTYLASIEGSRDNATSGQYGASMIFRTRTNGSAVMGAHMVINSVGNIGIGTTDPANKLQVKDATDISPTGSGAGQFAVLGNGYTTFLAMDGTAAYFGHNSSGRHLRLMTNETTRLAIDGSGTYIHSYTHFLPVANGTYNLGGSGNYWKNCYFEDTSINGGLTLSNDQTLQIGTTNGNAGKIRLYGNSGTAYYMDYQPVGTNDRQFRFNGSSSDNAYTTYFNQQGSGNHNLYVDGDITSAGTGRYIYAVNLNVTGYKNFEIEHPTKENMMLVHSSLEGPEAGVYHRGRVQSDTITMPDYWSGLVREGTITVQLTPNGSFQHLYVVSTSLSEIKIGAADGETIDCYYVIYGESADVDPLVVEDTAAWERFQKRKSARNEGKA